MSLSLVVSLFLGRPCHRLVDSVAQPRPLVLCSVGSTCGSVSGSVLEGWAGEKVLPDLQLVFEKEEVGARGLGADLSWVILALFIDVLPLHHSWAQPADGPSPLGATVTSEACVGAPVCGQETAALSD